MSNISTVLITSRSKKISQKLSQYISGNLHLGLPISGQEGAGGEWSEGRASVELRQSV